MSDSIYDQYGQSYGRDKFLQAYREAVFGILDLPQSNECVQPEEGIRVPDMELCEIC